MVAEFSNNQGNQFMLLSFSVAICSNACETHAERPVVNFIKRMLKRTFRFGKMHAFYLTTRPEHGCHRIWTCCLSPYQSSPPYSVKQPSSSKYQTKYVGDFVSNMDLIDAFDALVAQIKAYYTYRFLLAYLCV